jgi:hypothetical protein
MKLYPRKPKSREGRHLKARHASAGYVHGNETESRGTTLFLWTRGSEHILQKRDRATRTPNSYNTGGFDATNSANRLSFRTSANSASLYTLLKSLYPSSSAFLKYSSDRSE